MTMEGTLVGIEEIQNQIQVANEAANNLAASYTVAKETTDQVVEQFAALSAEGTAVQMAEVSRLLAEIPGIIAQAVEKPNEAHTQAEAARGLGTHGALAFGAELAAERPTNLTPYDYALRIG